MGAFCSRTTQSKHLHERIIKSRELHLSLNDLAAKSDEIGSWTVVAALVLNSSSGKKHAKAYLELMKKYLVYAQRRWSAAQKKELSSCDRTPGNV